MWIMLMTVDFTRINTIWDILSLKRSDDSTSCQVMFSETPSFTVQGISGPFLFGDIYTCRGRWQHSVVRKQNLESVSGTDAPFLPHIPLDLETSNSFHCSMLVKTWTVAQSPGNPHVGELYQCMHAFIRWYPNNPSQDLTVMNRWEERLGKL